MQLNGFHHLTAVTSHARGNVDFYTQLLGMRLVKKTVNQDDVSAYHLYYADAHGSPGTDVTFFDWATIGPQQPGTGAIDVMALRVDSRAAIDYWLARFDAHQVRHGDVFLWHGDRVAVHFWDPEGQRLMLISDEETPGGIPWAKSPVPAEYAIKGIFGAGITVRNREQMTLLYRDVLGFDLLSEGVDPSNPLHYQYLFAAGAVVGGALMVQVAPDLPPSRLGSGGVHHMAFRVPDHAAQDFWIERLQRVGLQPTQSIDRFYFRSVYARVPGNVLIEIATDGPGFATDEPLETMGETLALPPFLEPQRAQIEAGLKPI